MIESSKEHQMSLPVSYLMNRGTGTEGETFEPHTILDLKAAFILLVDVMQAGETLGGGAMVH